MDDSKDGIFHRRFIAFLALVLVAAALGYVYLVTFGTVPKDNIRFADTILGFILGTVLATPIGFYFGASKAQPPATPPQPPAAPAQPTEGQK